MMVLARSFAEFKPTYVKNFVTVADALSQICDDALMDNRRLKVKFLIATYFSMANLNEIGRGISFDFEQRQDGSHVSIANKIIPIYDIVEAKLYGKLFDEFTVNSYRFIAKPANLVKALRRFSKYVEPNVQLNSPFGAYALRQMRAWALVHDYGVSPIVIKKLFGFKTWIFPDITFEEALAGLKKERKPERLSLGKL